MNFQHVKDIIDEWDPLNVLPYAPDDEYEKEAQMILNILKEKKSKEELAKEIYELCINRFGPSGFEKDYDSCLTVAEKLINITENLT